MNLLLDTSPLLWWLELNPRLGATATSALADPNNQIFVSAVSAFEIALKLSRQRLSVPAEVASWLPQECEAHRFRPLPVTISHAAGVEHLPWHHRDPFDRILIAQAIAEDLRLVTSDAMFSRYGIPLMACG